MQQFEDKTEEIRTICRLHAYPTGHWENLVDLPFRLSQDAGLRTDLVEIVRSLQRSNLNLPDVLDLLVLAVGGSAAPAHSRELSDPLNQIGGFLSSVGRWPDTDTSPILAPGEVPENLEKFMRPQPRPVAQPAQRATSPTQKPEPVARPFRLFEARSKRAEATPASSPPQPRFSRPSLDQPGPDRLIASQPNTEPSSRPSDNRSSLEQNSKPTPEPRREPSTLVPEGDISQALGRLERGNLELRAHLDSIDQRISRMEPLLESGAPPPGLADLKAELAKAAASVRELPTLVHRDSPHRDPVPRDSAPREPLRTKPLPAEPLATKPLPTPSLQPEPIHTEPLGNAPPTVPIDSGPRIDRSPAPTRWPVPNAPDTPALTQSGSTPLPLPVAPRFSRFSRDPFPADPTSLDPAPLSTASVDPVSVNSVPTNSASPYNVFTGNRSPGRPSTSTTPDQQTGSQPDEPRPITLPRGFFGTIPEPDETTVDIPVDPPRRNRRLALIVTILILLGLAAAILLYLRNTAGNSDQSSNPSAITPVPAPRTPGTVHYPAGGSLPNGPQRTSAGQRPSSGERGGPATRGASQPTEIAAEPDGFRPAPNFVPASVMDGHLISAPLPSQPRVAASSGAQAMVVLEVNISSTGQVEDLYVLGGNQDLRSAAMNAVRSWRYKPYLLNGTPSEVRTIVRVDFTEHRSQPADRGSPFPR